VWEEGKVNATTAEGVEAPKERGLLGRIRRKRADRNVSFPELVWIHHLRQKDLEGSHRRPYSGAAEERYRDFEARFEEQHGKIVAAYWCTAEASAIVLTIKRRPLLLADTVRLHWATDWSTRDKPKLMTLLYECESLAVKVQEVLRDTSRRLAIQSLFNVVSFVLGFSETERARNERAVAGVARTTRAHLKEIEKYYRKAAARSGQIVYVGGVLLGMVPMVLLAFLAWLLIANAKDFNSPAGIGLLCFSAGGVGAMVSVMSRLSTGRVRLDWEFGKDTLRTLGALRPFVGAVFGLITFLALKSGIVNLADGDGSSYYYIVFAFVAGFSERFAQDMLLGVAGEDTSSSRKTVEQLPSEQLPEETSFDAAVDPETEATTATGL
jgi:hypothetical protein